MNQAKIENKIGDKGNFCENTPSTLAQSANAPGALSQTLRENIYDSRNDEKRNDRKKIEKWAVEQYHFLIDLFDDDIHAVKESEDYKEYRAEQDRRIKEWEDKYNCKWS